MRVEKNFMLIADPNTETDLSKTDLAYLHNLPSTRSCEYLEDNGDELYSYSNLTNLTFEAFDQPARGTKLLG